MELWVAAQHANQSMQGSREGRTVAQGAASDDTQTLLNVVVRRLGRRLLRRSSPTTMCETTGCH